ncbi:MAG: Cu(I)-responsive transcriptional regulator [Rhodothermia bacterium]|nr:MAG: Cu(I)-responsive transcriptional regulator [Rhodothermia bacterium]
METQLKRNQQMKRGQLAKITGVTLETVRYYEQRGLIPEPRRTGSGYRMYSEDYITRIRFIKRAQDLGFTLKEILELLSLSLAPDSDRADVKRQVNEKIRDIELKMVDLQRIKTALDELVSCCSGRGSTHECPILEFMEAQ